jgi:RNA polymerase sigma-70 factor (sigma-E family)
MAGELVSDSADSFDDFVVARGAALLRFAYVLTQDSGRAEDLVQVALMKAHRRWQNAARADQPEAYVRRIIANEFLSWRRRRSSRELPSRHMPEQTRPDSANAHAERDQMWRTLAGLPPRQRAVLVLRYYEDLTDAQIADLLGCALGTVRSSATRALATLRSLPTWSQDPTSAPSTVKEL